MCSIYFTIFRNHISVSSFFIYIILGFCNFVIYILVSKCAVSLFFVSIKWRCKLINFLYQAAHSFFFYRVKRQSKIFVCNLFIKYQSTFFLKFPANISIFNKLQASFMLPPFSIYLFGLLKYFYKYFSFSEHISFSLTWILFFKITFVKDTISVE